MKATRSTYAARFLPILGACLLAGAFSVSPSLARPDFGVRGGAYSEDTDPFLGAEALFSMDTSHRWYGNPNVEHAFVDNGDLTSMSFDVHYDFINNKEYSLWGGAGPTVLFMDGDAFADRSSTDVGANVLFGVGSTRGTVRPYAQVKVVFADDDQAVLGAGVRF
jgi:hypothetical protein